MTLTELKEYVQARRIVSEREISLHFRIEESAIEPMARRWVEKGLMAIVDMDGTKCGGCTACADGIKRLTNGSDRSRSRLKIKGYPPIKEGFD